MCQGIIYKATNLINGKCYIGQTIKKLEQRKKEHLHHMKKKIGNRAYQDLLFSGAHNFQEALYLYDPSNFKWEVIYECDEIMLDMMETFKIMVNHAHYMKGGYNLTWGGDYNPMHDSIVRKKISISNTGRKHTDDARRKMSEAQTGKKMSSETKNKLSKINKGKHLTEETKRKISKANKNKHLTEETKRKMRNAHGITDERLEQAKTLMCQGIGILKIARITNITYKTLHKYFRDDLNI